MVTLKAVLIETRKDLKLSLRKAAELIGISHSYLYNLEKGIDPRTKVPIKPAPEVLELISKAYKIDYNELMRLAGYLPEVSYDNDKKENSLEDFKEDLMRRLLIGGHINQDMPEKEKEELIDRVIKILEITKSN